MVGRYYMERRDYAGAINRFKIVVTRYQTTRHVEEALLRLTEAYLSLGIVGEAQTSAAVLGHNFPDSRWYKDAYALVQQRGLQPSENRGSWISQAFRKLGVGSTGRRGRQAGDLPQLRAKAAIPYRPDCARHVVFDDGESAQKWMPGRGRAISGTDTAMLTRLSIRDIVLIDRLDIDFADGLAVLTGETGAGKSILLDAFALALGARGDAALVRHGAEQGQVTAAFELPRDHPVRALPPTTASSRGRTDPAARAVRRRPHPRLRQRPAGQRAGAAGARRRAGRDPRPA